MNKTGKSQKNKKQRLLVWGGVIAGLIALFALSLLIPTGGGGVEFENTRYMADYERIPRITPNKLPKAKEPLKLSDLVEDFNVVRLDSENVDALLGAHPGVNLSRNFVGIIERGNDIPLRLYDKATGEFIRKIGSIGRGPGEYNSMYDFVIDEPGDRVYLTPFARTSIFEYTLSGRFVGEIAIPALGEQGNRKTKFELRDSIFTAYILPFPTDSLLACTFTKSGRLLSTIPNIVGGVRNFDNDLFVTKNDSGTGYLASFASVYYRYDHRTDSLGAVFGLEAIDGYASQVRHETATNYLVMYHPLYVEGMEEMDENERPETRWFYIDKLTYEGVECKLVNDFLGGIEVVPFQDGQYYTELVPAIELKRKLGEALAENDMTADVKARVEALHASFDEEDNHFLFYGKLKE